MSATVPVVFLVDVDNTLLDNDAVLEGLRRHVEQDFGAACWERYWEILMALWDELGCRDYLGALQRYRIEHPRDPHLLARSFFQVDSPFAGRRHPGGLDVLARLRGRGPTVILSDGDAVLRPRKVQRSGHWRAVDGRVPIHVHKERELDDVAARYPAEHYVLIDDKPAALTPAKRAGGERPTTVFPRQGQYAHDPKILAANTPADVTIDRSGDLLAFELPTLKAAARPDAAPAGTDTRTTAAAARGASAAPPQKEKGEQP